MGYEWELVKSPAGANQWTPKNGAAAGTVPDAHDPFEAACSDHVHDRSCSATGSDLCADREALLDHPQEFADAFAKAWFKLTHRDMGPTLAVSRPAGSGGAADLAGSGSRGGSSPIGEQEIAALKAKILASGLSISELVSTAWASAHPSAAPTSAAERTEHVFVLRRKRIGK